MKITRVSTVVFALALLGTSMMAPRPAEAACKPDGQRCRTDVSCCGGNCVKPDGQPGKAKPVFGTCCTPATCDEEDCGTIDDGCGGTLDCGSCPTTTTSTTATTSTTVLPVCSGTHVDLICECGNGAPCLAFRCDGEFPRVCAQARLECIQGLCPVNGGPGTCATNPCLDCTTGEPCQ